MNNQRVFGVVVVLAAVFVSCAIPEQVTADSISASLAYQFLDRRADNSAGVPAGEFQQFGANCVVRTGFPCTRQNLAATAGTTGIATQAGFPTAIPLTFLASDLTSNHFSASRNPSAVPDGAWTLTFSNGSDTAVTTTPSLVGAVRLDFASSMTISGSGALPQFTWSLPALAPGAAIDSVRIVIRDTTDFRGVGGAGGSGIATIIYANTFAAGTTSFTVTPGDPRLLRSLDFGKTYSLELQLADTRDNLRGGGFSNTLSQSRSFFDFTLLPDGAPPSVFLPTLVLGATPYYSFARGVPVVPGTMVFVDPLVAVGYDYETGPGDPNFSAVLLPTGIGDDLFDLHLWDGTKYVDSGIDLTGGVTHAFGGAGVDRFRILGIEATAGLDPFDVTAFITGLEFVTEGTFTGTMTPLTATVPAPTALGLLSVAVLIQLARARGSRNRHIR